MKIKKALQTLRQSSPEVVIPFRVSKNLKNSPDLPRDIDSPIKRVNSNKLNSYMSFRDIKGYANQRQTFHVKRNSPILKHIELFDDQQNIISNHEIQSPYKKPKGNHKTTTLPEQSAYGLAEAHKLENNSLKETIKILKQQIQLLNNRLEECQKQKKKHELMVKVKEEQSKQRDRKYKQYKKKSKEYDELEPRLNELEDMQAKLIEENKKYKQRQTISKSILENVGTLLMMEQDRARKQNRKCNSTIQKLIMLVEAYDF